MDNNTEEVHKSTDVKKKSATKWACLMGVLIGCVMLFCGLFSVTGNKEMDLALISGGTTQTCVSLISENEEAVYTLATIADVMEATLEAREDNSPEKLNAFINSHFSEYALQQGSTSAIVQAIMVYVNSAYKKSATEAEYWEKLQVIISGIRSAISSHTQKAA